MPQLAPMEVIASAANSIGTGNSALEATQQDAKILDWIYNCIVSGSHAKADNFGYLEAGNFAGDQEDQQAARLDKIDTAYTGMPLTVNSKATVNNNILIDEENFFQWCRQHC